MKSNKSHKSHKKQSHCINHKLRHNV